MPDRTEPLNIFVIEDSEAHAKILRWAFERLERRPQVTFFPDGETVLTRLTELTRSQRPVPDLIVLDLNLPRMGGKNTLRKLKNDPFTRDVPVIVLSSSDNDNDVRSAYEFGASTFICKADILGELRVALQALLDYWTVLARLPKRT